MRVMARAIALGLLAASLAAAATLPAVLSYDRGGHAVTIAAPPSTLRTVVHAAVPARPPKPRPKAPPRVRLVPQPNLASAPAPGPATRVPPQPTLQPRKPAPAAPLTPAPALSPAPAPAAAPTIVAGTQQPAAPVQAEPTRSLADTDRHDHGRHRGRGHHHDDAVAAPDEAPAPDAVVPSDQEPEAPVDATVAATEPPVAPPDNEDNGADGDNGNGNGHGRGHGHGHG